MLSGLIPNEGTDSDALKRRLLCGRYAELRMLFFLGKDVFRWIDQCVEWAERVPEFGALEIRRQSFAGLLTKDPPEAVKEKLVRWGVVDYVSIFSRAIGMNAVFVEPPAMETLNEEFLRNYHRYPDFLYRCYMEIGVASRLCRPANFRFAFTRRANTRECWRRSGTETRRIEPPLLIRIEVAIQVEPKNACEAGHGGHHRQICHKGRHQHQVEAPRGQPPQQQHQHQDRRNREHIAEVHGAQEVSLLPLIFQVADGTTLVHGEIGTPQGSAKDLSLMAARAQFTEDWLGFAWRS